MGLSHRFTRSFFEEDVTNVAQLLSDLNMLVKAMSSSSHTSTSGRASSK